MKKALLIGSLLIPAHLMACAKEVSGEFLCSDQQGKSSRLIVQLDNKLGNGNVKVTFNPYVPSPTTNLNMDNIPRYNHEQSEKGRKLMSVGINATGQAFYELSKVYEEQCVDLGGDQGGGVLQVIYHEKMAWGFQEQDVKRMKEKKNLLQVFGPGHVKLSSYTYFHNPSYGVGTPDVLIEQTDHYDCKPLEQE